MKIDPLSEPRPMKKLAISKKSAGAKVPAVRLSGKAAHAADLLGRDKTEPSRSNPAPAKWRWHDRVLLALQSRLLKERGELLSTTAEPLERRCVDLADSAADEFDHDLAVSMLATEQNALEEVKAALDRIRNGTFGICEQSGAPIPAARLRAVPWARFTREAAERREQRTHAHPAPTN